MPDVLKTLNRAIFLVSLPFGILGFVLPIYGVEIGASAVQIGMFFTAFSIMFVIARPIVGWALDRYGRRWFFLAGLLGYALTMVFFAYARDVNSIIIARMLQGGASSVLWLALSAIIADVAAADDRGESFGRNAQASAQGTILGTTIGFTLLFWQGVERGWLIQFLAFGVVGLISFLITIPALPETMPHNDREHKVSPIRWSQPWIMLLLVTFVTAAAWGFISPVIMIYLQDKLGATVSDLAWAYLPTGLIWALLPSRLGKLADRVGRKPLMVIALIVAALTSAVVPFVNSLIIMAILWGLQALSFAAGDPAEQALVADLTGGDQRGRGYGMYTLMAGLGFAVGPLAGGWLYDNVSTAMPFYANGVILILNALVLALFLHEPGVKPST